MPAKRKTRTAKAKKDDAPKSIAERNELLDFIGKELLAPNNINVDLDFTDPDALDDELNEVIKRKKIKRDEVGRPTKMTVPTLMKLKVAYLIDASDEEACKFAGISTSPLYAFQKKYPEFKELKNKWKETYIMAARLNVFNSVVGKKNIDDSWRVLRTKRRDEYAEKSMVEAEEVITIDELKKISEGDYSIEAAKPE